MKQSSGKRTTVEQGLSDILFSVPFLVCYLDFLYDWLYISRDEPLT